MSVLVLGEALIDRFHTADGSRDVPGGSAANVALGVARLGTKSTLGTWISEDEGGRLLASHLAESGVILAPGSVQADATSVANIMLSESGDASYRFDLQWAPPVFEVEDDVTAVHCGSIAAVLAPGADRMKQVVANARKQAIITFDPNARPDIMDGIGQARQKLLEFSYLADVVKVSDEDCAWLTNRERADFQPDQPQPDQSRPDLVDDWFDHGVSLVVITAGSKGSVAYLPDGGTFTEVPAASAVVDTVGAGDSVMAGILMQLGSLGIHPKTSASPGQRRLDLDEKQVHQILHFASTVAGLTCERAGADLPTLAQVESRI